MRRWAYIGSVLAVVFLIAGCAVSEKPPEVAPVAEASGPHFVEVTEAAGLGAFSHENGGYGQSLMPEIVGGGGGFLDYGPTGEMHRCRAFICIATGVMARSKR